MAVSSLCALVRHNKMPVERVIELNYDNILDFIFFFYPSTEIVPGLENTLLKFSTFSRIPYSVGTLVFILKIHIIIGMLTLTIAYSVVRGGE